MSLGRYKEPKIESARYPFNLNFLTKRHFYWIAECCARSMEGPSKGFSRFAGAKSQITTSSYHSYFDILTAEEIDCARLELVLIMTKTELPFIIPTPSNDFLGIFKKHEITILCSDYLFDPNVLFLQGYVCLLRRDIYYNLGDAFITSALAIIIPSPCIELSFLIHS